MDLLPEVVRPVDITFNLFGIGVLIKWVGWFDVVNVQINKENLYT